jgi:hypothetical protein
VPGRGEARFARQINAIEAEARALQEPAVDLYEGAAMVPASNVVPLATPARAAAPAPDPSRETPLVAVAAQAWHLQFELAWSYPRLCYALWSRLTTLHR